MKSNLKLKQLLYFNSRKKVKVMISIWKKAQLKFHKNLLKSLESWKEINALPVMLVHLIIKFSCKAECTFFHPKCVSIHILMAK